MESEFWGIARRHKFRDNEVRLQLHALAYNLANFMRTLALPQEVEHWSLTTIREKLVKSDFGSHTGNVGQVPTSCLASCHAPSQVRPR